MKTQLFVLCTKEIKHHSKVAFHKGHVYVADLTFSKSSLASPKANEIYSMSGEDNSQECFPKMYFKENFKVIFPVMESLK
jgi:hypothetical protein